ncbi:SPLICING FACTOR 3B [Salix koriyanagi]|uniref:SPLICING FACTOR 3B n=1 Tax=Salix koriyanagi TaxID=2511006 RepID=A0A9Q0TRW7_9ROSI|nr:SPLICING FACTOR 3B [Salix koriyanagi]
MPAFGLGEKWDVNDFFVMLPCGDFVVDRRLCFRSPPAFPLAARLSSRSPLAARRSPLAARLSLPLASRLSPSLWPLASLPPSRLSRISESSKINSGFRLQNPSKKKKVCSRPDVVEVWDATSADPKLLVFLKSYKNTVPVPRHWCQKRKFLQGSGCDNHGALTCMCLANMTFK